MTEEQRQQRAAFVREQPGLWLFLLYAVVFVGSAAASDALQEVSGVAPSRLRTYLLPLVVALPLWRWLRLWARRAASGPIDHRAAGR